jgi:cytochrome c oxidase subunit 2
VKPRYRQVICIIIAAILIILGGLLIGERMYRYFLPPSASVEAVAYDDLFRFTVSIAAMIFLLVEGVLIYVIVRYRRRRGDNSDGPPIHGNTGLEIAWTIMPAVIVTVLAIYSYNVLKVYELPYDSVAAWFCGPLTPAQALAEPISGGDLTVDVIGRQYNWEFRYPQYDNVSSAEMHVPVDEYVLLRLTSEDVIHSFWVPQFRLKKDALPGFVTEARFEATETGVYPIICAELCGMGHSEMRASLVVESREDFDAWIDGLVSESVGPSDPVTVGRKMFIRLGCGSCHTLGDVGAGGQLAPPLDGLGGRAGSRIPDLSAEEYVRRSMLEPKSFLVEGHLDVMPEYGDRMTDVELDAFVEYLLQQ